MNTLFQQHKRELYTWTSPDGQHRNQIDYILCSQRWRSSIELAKTTPRADNGSDHELLIAKFRLKLKKVAKAARPFMYNLDPLPLYSGSDKQIQGIRSDRVPEELWMEVFNIVQEAVINTSPRKRNAKKAKQLSEEALQIAEKRRNGKDKEAKERYTHLSAEFQRIAKRGRKPS